MNSLILRTSAQLLQPLMLLFSLFLLVRGHNEPGGGFVAGLLAAAAFALYVIAYDTRSARQFLRFEPRILVGIGLLSASASGLPALLLGQPFMQAQWLTLHLAGGAELALGTPLLFDIGVYLVVVGSVCMILFALGDD